MTFYCPHCGEEVEEDAAFCPHCGSDDETGWSDSSYLSYLPAEEDLDLEPTRRHGPPVKPLIVLVLLLVLSGLTFLLRVRIVAICLLVLSAGVLLQVLVDRRQNGRTDPR